MTDIHNSEYEKYKKMFKGYRYPLAFVDLDRFDQNIAYVAATQKKTGKTIRVASKSIRCLDLIKRVFKKGKEAYRGILAFTMEEACYLFDRGLDDIIVAYPSIQPSDIDIFIEKAKQGATLSLVVDCLEHLKILSRAGEKAGIVLNTCLDIDMSYRPLGNIAHIGVRRSPVHSLDQAVHLAKASQNLTGVRINSVMGYEAQIASVNDDCPGQSIKNAVIRFVKNRSVTELTKRRQRIVNALESEGLNFRVVNGGGSGSLVSTGMDRSVTEVTAGSAFFAPGLFRYFNDVKFKPAAFFGLQVTRIPHKGTITCQGGGYVASGEVNDNRLPWPVMPEGLKYLSMEGAGEVQTPLVMPKQAPEMNLCDPVFFSMPRQENYAKGFLRFTWFKTKRLSKVFQPIAERGKLFYNKEIKMEKDLSRIFDFVFVGAGISGPFIANDLCSEGCDCLMVEAGKYFTRRTYPSNGLDGTSQLYWSGGLELGHDCKIVFLRPKVVGGGSIVNQALVDRFDEDALKS